MLKLLLTSALIAAPLAVSAGGGASQTFVTRGSLISAAVRSGETPPGAGRAAIVHQIITTIAPPRPIAPPSPCTFECPAPGF